MVYKFMLKLKLDHLLCVPSRNKSLEQQLLSLKDGYQLKLQESANDTVDEVKWEKRQHTYSFV